MYKHIFIDGYRESENYKTPRPGFESEENLPSRNRLTHSQRLLQRFDEITEQKKKLKRQRDAEGIPTRDGTYIQFSGSAGYELTTKSLEGFSQGVRLLNVREVTVEVNKDEKVKTFATVYVPSGQEGVFIRKIKRYQKNADKDKGKPSNAKLVDSIEDISMVALEGLWTDRTQPMPTDTAKWCEVWLRTNTVDGKVPYNIAQFTDTLKSVGIEYKSESIIFPERAVLLIYANGDQLLELMMQSDLLAEFRASQEPAGFWVNEPRAEQYGWVTDLLERLRIEETNIKVCLLDSGVNNKHRLLEPIIDDENTLSAISSWGTHDHYGGSGHGTLMAGIAGYGNLEGALLSRNIVPVSHQLCSVKIIPNRGQSERELWGDITSQGISRAEVQNPNMTLIYCMAVTSFDDVDKGRPSSWSGAIDNLTFGDDNKQRLIIISAGNVREEHEWRNYPDANFAASVQNPAQAWNAVTVGAYTEKVRVNDTRYNNHTPIATEGQLSPYSSTSRFWEESKWPIKPDVVFEGGNLLKSPDGFIGSHEDLELLSTSKAIDYRYFDTFSATSAAAAQASWFAAKIAYRYPEAWPETVRALMIHSAEWSPAMLKQLDINKDSNKGDYQNLLRTFGYGVPNLGKALYSKESALTYIAQEVIQPYRFKKDKSGRETYQMHFYRLPWARDLLLEMGNTNVRLKITLSYFIEPGAGEIGWKDKYTYQSHGLRFDVNNVTESEEEFRKRVNAAAREEGEKHESDSGPDRWKIGTRGRTRGSIHIDLWEGTAAELATCNLIAIYPTIGWWRERHQLGRVENTTRYSLIVSLETPAQDVELYTTVKNMIEVPVEIKT